MINLEFKDPDTFVVYVGWLAWVSNIPILWLFMLENFESMVIRDKNGNLQF